MFRRCISLFMQSAVVAATTICLALSNPALAAKPPSNEQLFEMVKALQSRVAVLEEQNGRYQRKLMEVRKGGEPARLQLASLPYEGKSRSADEPRPMGLANPSGSALQPADNWSGMYFGASFGAGETKGSHSGTLFISPSPPNFLETREDTNIGATADLFIGFNSRIGSRIVGGVQLEGSMASLNFDADGTTTLSPQNYTAHVDATWMASALARVGWLIRPNTMLYGLAGLTFAHFETDRGFINIHEYDANGLSVGAGIEKKIGPDWSVRAEYRFTDFGKTDKNFSLPLTSSSGENQFNNEMHIGRIGIARRLGRSEPTGGDALK